MEICERPNGNPVSRNMYEGLWTHLYFCIPYAVSWQCRAGIILFRVPHPCFGNDAIGVRVRGYCCIAWYVAIQESKVEDDLRKKRLLPHFSLSLNLIRRTMKLFGSRGRCRI